VTHCPARPWLSGWFRSRSPQALFVSYLNAMPKEAAATRHARGHGDEGSDRQE
jgi:hypothetical protein